MDFHQSFDRIGRSPKAVSSGLGEIRDEIEQLPDINEGFLLVLCRNQLPVSKIDFGGAK